MKNELFFRGDHDRVCALCEFGRLSADGEKVLCEKRGVTEAGASCRKFVYDPFRRTPARRPAPPAFSPEDFTV